MSATPTLSPSAAVVATEVQAARAFALWEERYRANASDFLTHEEVARMAVADVSTASAIYFRALLREVALADADAPKYNVYAGIAAINQDAYVVLQAAWIEWQRGAGAEKAMSWIHNTLVGPGLIPGDQEPHAGDAQAWFSANCARPMPACATCGAPSCIAWMGKGFCSDAHYQAARAVESQTKDDAA